MMMLDFLGRSLDRRGAYFNALQERVLASDAVSRHQRRVVHFLKAARRVLNEPLRVSIIGEVNTGKTELANLILGIQVLPTSVVNNTLSPTIIRFAETPSVRRYLSRTNYDEKDASELHRLVQQRGFLVECLLPLPLLRSIEIIDFPAFEVTDLFTGRLATLLGRSDLLVWCSASSRAWTASEKSAWQRLPERLMRNCLFTLTHADRLAEAARAEVAARVRAELALRGIEPVSIAIPSAIEARNPRGQIMNGKLWNASGGERFLKGLFDLLQNALNHRQQRVGESAEKFVHGLAANGTGAGSDDLGAEWAKLARAFEPDPASPSTAPDAAAAVLAMRRFKQAKCAGWLRARNRPPEEIEAFLGLLPDTTEALLAKADAADTGRFSRIYQQLTQEIQDYTDYIQGNS